MRPSLSIAATCVATAIASPAYARPSLTTQASSTQVEVGQRFEVQVTCNLEPDSDSPSDPRLPAPREVPAVQGPSISTSQSISFVNGRMTRKSGVTATWVLAATTPGKFRIGPASMVVDGQKIIDRAFEISVVAASANPQAGRGRRRTLPFDPFDPFGGGDPFSGPMFPPLPGLKLDLGQDEPTLPSYPPELSINAAKDPTAFLDARALPKRVVIGEQIRLNVYAYNKPGVTDAINLSEPSLDGFLSYRSEHDDLLTKAFAINIGEERFFARKVLSYALFPTKTGTLTIGPTVMTFASRTRLANGSNETAERSSNPVTIFVEEPPLKGRPPFYHLGDVGQFKLSATVEPRQVTAGEAVSVQVEVNGTGQLPQRIDPPEQAGVDWLEPSVSQQLGEQRELIGGSRQFSYVVRLNREGPIDLGELRFAFFDPTTRKYSTVKAKLGTVEVKPNTAAASTNPTQALGASPADSAAQTLLPRGKVSPIPALQKPLTERPLFFFWLGFGPSGTLVLFGLKHGLDKARALRKKRSTSAKSLVQVELDAARQALMVGDFAKTASAVERAVHLVIEHRAGLRSRAILRNELGPRLVATGLDDSVVQGLIDLLERCDHQRFVQTNVQSSTQLLDDATARVTTALAAATKSAKVSS